MRVLSDTPDLSLASRSRSGFHAHPRLVLPHTDSSSNFYGSYLDKVLPDKIYIFKCRGPLGLENSSAKILPINTISIALYGATIGKVGLLKIRAATNQACCNCIPNIKKIDPLYLLYFFISQRKDFIEKGQGGAQPNLTNEIIHNWQIPLPPLTEQHEIVRRVGALFEGADAIEREVVAASRRCERLTQAVLGKAFRGELTINDSKAN